jgi:type IV pilus assembly protein PilO
MPDLRDTRRKLKIAFAGLAVVDVAALAILFSPLVGSELARRQQLDDLWKQLQQKTRQVEPLRGLDKKVVLARQQIDNFYKDRLPDRDSAISEALGRVAGQTGVKIEHFKYNHKDTEAVGLRPLEVEASLSGNYLQLVKFINSLEREQVFFIVESVDLGGEQAGVVRLQIKLESYLKPGAA